MSPSTAIPTPGVEVYETPPTSQNPWQQAGRAPGRSSAGRAWRRPAWAGIIAIVDQGRAQAGLGSLSGATQTLPALYDLTSVYNPVSPSSSGGTSGGSFPWGGYESFGDELGFLDGSTPQAGATANTQTGLGTPVGSPLVDELAASTTTVPLTTSTASATSSTSPTPAPSPTPSPTPTKPHHHKKVAHPAKKAKAKIHASTAHGKRVVKQKAETHKDHQSKAHSAT